MIEYSWQLLKFPLIATQSITTPTDDLPEKDLPGGGDEPMINAPFSLGDVQGISLFVGLFFVGIGLVVFYIMKRGK